MPISFFTVRDEPRPADLIVVLGGGPERFPHAMSLYEEGWAPRLLFLGTEFSRAWGDMAVRSGVPLDSVTVIEPPKNTREEARFGAAWVRGRPGIDTLILVTSEYHSRRALGEFRRVLPEKTILSCPAPTPAVYGVPKRREWYALWVSWLRRW